MHFGPWDIVAFGTLYIGAFLLATDVGLRMSPRVQKKFSFIPRMQDSAWWAFTPFIMLTVAGAMILARVTGFVSASGPGEALSEPGHAGVAAFPTWAVVFLFFALLVMLPAMWGLFLLRWQPGKSTGHNRELAALNSSLQEALKRVDKLEQSPASATAEDHSKLVTTVVNLAKDTDARLSDSIEKIRGQLSGMHDRIESDRNHTASIFRILSTSLRARDAEAIIKEADEVAMTVSKKLMTGGYPDEAAWTADYTIWRDAIARIDGVVSSWQDHHRPYLAIGLKELEAGAPTPPPESNVTSSNGVMWYKTVWLVQQSYSNHRESMRRYFHAKAGELPG
jgi:hypothetical protein